MKYEGAFITAIIFAAAAVFAAVSWYGSGGLNAPCNRDGTCDSAHLVCVKKTGPWRFTCELKTEASK